MSFTQGGNDVSQEIVGTVNNVRLASFVDAEEPGYHASRSAADLNRMAAVAHGHRGPLVALQHVPVDEPGGEVVAFAAARGITVVPEIEMPGHSAAILKVVASARIDPDAY